MLDIPIRDAGLSVRAFHILYAGDIKTVRDLLAEGRYSLAKYRNMGRKTMCGVDALMCHLGLSDIWLK